MSAVLLCTPSSGALQGICSACLDRDAPTGSICRTIWGQGIDFQHCLFLLILYSSTRSWNISFNMSNPGSSDLRENLCMAMDVIWFLLAFLPRVCLFFLGCPPYLGAMSLVHSTLIQLLFMSYFSLDLRDCRDSFLNLIKGGYQKSIAHITLSCET